MHGLVSLLPKPSYRQVQDIWETLAKEHGLRGIRVTPYPHFSWQIAKEYDFDRLEDIIAEIGLKTPPIIVHTAGLGLFSGNCPVIYVSVVKDPNLMRLHADIWGAVQPAAQDLSPYYAPSAWMPHISLAYEDVTPTNIGPVVQRLAYQSLAWEMRVDNIALIYEPEGQIGALKFQIQLTG
jgi:2'-5' RNA ligase